VIWPESSPLDQWWSRVVFDHDGPSDIPGEGSRKSDSGAQQPRG